MVTLNVPRYLSAGNNNRLFIQNCVTLLGGKASWWRGAVADAAWGGGTAERAGDHPEPH